VDQSGCSSTNGLTVDGLADDDGTPTPRTAGPRALVPRRLIAVAALIGAAAAVAGVVVLTTRDADVTAPTTTTTTVADRTRPTTTTPTTSATVTTMLPTPTDPATAAGPPPGGRAGPGCASGWSVPPRGTPLRTAPLDLMRRGMSVAGEFEVIEMRYFTSPEVPWILAPRPPVLEWWYVKAQLVGDPAFRARWLVVRRSPVAQGIAAVARFDTHGYRSPDWRAFLGEGTPRAIEGLPGRWTGFEYDFTVGEDREKPGLPVEAVHCLDGT
jgi:hypothetical protein